VRFATAHIAALLLFAVFVSGYLVFYALLFSMCDLAV